jgi:hypothetical protein
VVDPVGVMVAVTLKVVGKTLVCVVSWFPLRLVVMAVAVEVVRERDSDWDWEELGNELDDWEPLD